MNRISPSRWALGYARVALGAAFLSGIASRFGLWGKGVGYGDFAHFVQYTAQVNAFMPRATIPYLAWSATAAELGLGMALVLGILPQWTAWASAILLLLFGTAMTISFGIKSPLDYSVFSASAAALLLAQSTPAPGRASHQPSAFFRLAAWWSRGAVPLDGGWAQDRGARSTGKPSRTGASVA